MRIDDTHGIKADYKYIDHLGNGFDTIDKMCQHWGIKRSTFVMRRVNGASLEEALTKPTRKIKNNSGSKDTVSAAINKWSDHLGNEFPTLKELCKHWGVAQNEYEYRMRHGATVKQALTSDYSDQIGYTDTLGIHYNTAKEMCRTWRVPYSLYIEITDRGGTFDDVVYASTGIEYTKASCEDHLGNKYKTLKSMCIVYGLSVVVFTYRLKSGMSLEDALTCNGIVIRDHEGNEFNTVKEMCKYWDVAYNTYRNRRNNGVSLEDALTVSSIGIKVRGTEQREAKDKDGTYKDHLGIKYKSFSAMCKQYGIGAATVKERLNAGMTIKDALMTRNVICKQNKIYKDHLGNSFGTMEELCRHWGISQSTFNSRMKRMNNIKDALEYKKIGPSSKKCKDHLNVEYDSIKDMCKHWNIDRRRFNARLRYGWTLEEALTIKDTEGAAEKRLRDRIKSGKKYKDHLGNEFYTIEDMCSYWDIDSSTYNYRIKNGWSLEEALTIRTRKQYKRDTNNCVVNRTDRCEDHLGNKFNSIEELCKHWNIGYNTYYYRLKSGRTVKETLETPTRMYRHCETEENQ